MMTRVSHAREFGETRGFIKIMVDADNEEILGAAAVQGIGFVRFADYYVQEEISNGELEPVLEKFEVQDAATWIMFPDRHHLPTRVRYLIDFLVERLRVMDHTQGDS